MILQLLAALATSLVLYASTEWRPTSARCPEWAYVNGVRRSDGRFGCRPRPLTRGDGHRTEVDDGTPDVEVFGQIHCTGGSQPIVVDDRSVGCQ